MSDTEQDTNAPGPSGPPDTGTMFAALLQKMNKMKKNILSISEPVDFVEESSERENVESNDTESLNERVAHLTANTPTKPSILVDIVRDLDTSEKTGPAASEDLAGIAKSLLKEKLPRTKSR